MALLFVACTVAGSEAAGTASSTGATSTSAGTSTSTGMGELPIAGPPDHIAGACPDPGTYDWDEGITGGSGAPAWSISGKVHLHEVLGTASVCMSFYPVQAGAAGQTLKGIGFTLCLPPKTWNVSTVTYRYTTNLPEAPVEMAVEFFVDKNGNDKPDSGEIEGWYNSTATDPIHAFNDARGVEVGANDCPEHVDFWVDTMP